MNGPIVRCIAKIPACLLTSVFVMAMILCHASAFAECMPTVSNSIQVNGIVVSTASPGLPVGCPGDQGWAGVFGQSFHDSSGPDITFNSTIFLAGYNKYSDATLDSIYLGVHVENDPEIGNKDILTLYFDANGNNSWDNDLDFALLYKVGPMTPPSGPDLETCYKEPQVQFYWYSPDSTSDKKPWKPQQEDAPNAITSKVSWDMDDTTLTGDPEKEIWELEVGIDVANMTGFSAPSSGTGFGVGAKLYIYQSPVDGRTPLRWPSNLTVDNNPNHVSPNQGNVVAGSLIHPKVGDCADVVFWPDKTTGVTATDNKGRSNKFTRLEEGDFDATGNALKQNHFVANVKFHNPSNLVDVVAFPNVGKVKFYINPWNVRFLGPNNKGYPIGEYTVTFDHLNQEKKVSFEWPQTKDQYGQTANDQPRQHLKVSEHTCLTVELDGFAVNLNEASDVVKRNLTYIQTSTVRDTFVISSIGVGPPLGKTILDYILRVKWRNIPPASKKGWSYKFVNAKKVGLIDLGNGYFSMQMRLREEKRVEIEISGGDMPVPPQEYTLSPRAAGVVLNPSSGDSSLVIPMQPGEIVTIIAHGQIQVNPQDKRWPSNGPNGFSNARLAAASQFLLSDDYYTPSQHIGALVGSFDNFETAFVVGTDYTFVVPAGVQELALGINDIIGAYDNNTGNGFDLHILITEPVFLPTRLASPGDANLGLPARPRAGSNLPELDIDVFQTIKIEGEEKATLLKPTGYVSYGVYASRPEEPSGICGPVRGVSLGISLLVMVLGIALLWQYVQRKSRRSQGHQILVPERI